MPESTQKTDPESPKASPPPIPDPAAYDIALLRGRHVAYARVPKHITFSQLGLVYGCIGVLIGIVNLFRHVTQAVLFPTTFVVVVAVLIVGALGVAFIWRARLDLKRSAVMGKMVGKLPPYETQETSRRIRLLAEPFRAMELLGSLEDVKSGFEPEIARVPLAVGLDPAAQRLAWLGGVLGCVFAILFESLFHWRMTELSLTIWFVMGSTSLGAIVIPEFVFPTYIRVIPGRLDVIRAPLIGSKLITVKSFDLRHDPIVLAGSVVFIEAPRESGTPPPTKIRSKKWPHAMMYPDDYRPDAVSLFITPHRKRIEQAILWAATTEAPTPELPSDSLIG